MVIMQSNIMIFLKELIIHLISLVHISKVSYFVNEIDPKGK